MLKTLGIIDGLLTTDRQRRNACRTLGGKTVLEWVARQMTDTERLDGVIVVTNESEENMFVRQMTPLDVPVFAADTCDTLKAIALSLEAFPAEHCVFIGLDWPLIDSHLVDRLILAAESNPAGEYAAFHFENSACSIKGRPTGMFAEWYNVRSLHRANRKASDTMYREYPGMYFIEQSPKNVLTLIPAPKQFDRDDIRWTIENEDDWENVVTLFESIDADNIQWPRIAENLLHHSHIQSGMKRHSKPVSMK